jgi:transposase-like protein
MKKGKSTHEIARQHGIHQETTWFFKRKVQQAMRESMQPLLIGLVQVERKMAAHSDGG